MMIGPAPDGRGVALDEEAQGHELDPVRLERLIRPSTTGGCSKTPNMRGMLGP